MKYLILFSLLFTTSAAQALTWNDIFGWDDDNDPYGSYIRNKQERCWKRTTWEEYHPPVGGSGRDRGYVRHHNRLEEIHC